MDVQLLEFIAVLNVCRCALSVTCGFGFAIGEFTLYGVFPCLSEGYMKYRRAGVVLEC